MEREGLAKRAAELRELAESRNVELEAELAALPKGDPIAEIGLLASKLGMDFGTAFDTSLDVRKEV